MSRRLIGAFVMVTALITAACNGIATPGLTVDSLSPGSVIEGSGEFELTVRGSGFISSTRVVLMGWELQPA